MAMPGGRCEHRLAQIGDGAVRRFRQAGNEPQQGRLAGASAAEQSDDLSLRQLKIDAVEHQVLAAVGPREGLTQAVNIEEGGGHGRC